MLKNEEQNQDNFANRPSPAMIPKDIISFLSDRIERKYNKLIATLSFFPIKEPTEHFTISALSCIWLLYLFFVHLLWQ